MSIAIIKRRLYLQREKSDMIDKRQYERIAVSDFPIELYTKNHPVEGKYIGTVENISLGGMLVTLPEMLAEEPNRIFVSFTFPSGEKLEFLRARVARSFPMEDRHAYGLAFFVLPIEKKELIKQGIANLKA